MTPTREKPRQAAMWLMLLSAASVVLSIAVCQIFLGLALIALIASDAPLRFPPLKAPLFGFLGWTVLSLLASGHSAAGLPQLRKFFVFSVLLVASTVLREAWQAKWLAGAWFVAAAVSSIRSLVQFGHKVDAARASGEDFYDFYVGERITGFLSHWMTFSEVAMMVLLVLLSFLFFAPDPGRRNRWLAAGCVVVLVSSLLVSFTRSVWLATGVAVGYLVWHWRKKLLLAAPVLALAGLVAAPGAVQKRLQSMARVQGDDSSSARIIMWRTGFRMINDHPLLGVGPERVGPEFRRYLPADVIELPSAFYGHLHNLYIHYGAERGIPAVLLLLWLLGTVLRDHWRASRLAKAPEERFILHAVLAVVIAILVGGFFEVNLGDSEVLTVFLTVVSLGYVSIDRLKAPEHG